MFSFYYYNLGFFEKKLQLWFLSNFLFFDNYKISRFNLKKPKFAFKTLANNAKSTGFYRAIW